MSAFQNDKSCEGETLFSSAHRIESGTQHVAQYLPLGGTQHH